MRTVKIIKLFSADRSFSFGVWWVVFEDVFGATRRCPVFGAIFVAIRIDNDNDDDDDGKTTTTTTTAFSK